MLEKLTGFLDNYLITPGIPGYDCAVYHKGKCVYRHMNGYSDLENKIPVDGSERYNIYSCSKPITVAAALQLYEKCVLSLDAPLSEYLPEYREMTVCDESGTHPASREITVADLFTMTAGFDYNTGCESLKKAYEETGGRCPTRETAAYFAKEPLHFEPGTQWNYSLCHDVLAAAVEAASGIKFGEYVKKNIFEPLGMMRSTFSLPENELCEIAPQYRVNIKTLELRGCGRQINAYKFGSEYESGGAGCISTVSDYIKFLEALRCGESILKRETVELMTTDRLNDVTRPYFVHKESHGYGLGVRCQKHGGGETDFGWGGAAGAYLAVDIPSKISVYCAQNVLGSDVGESNLNIIRIIREALL